MTQIGHLGALYPTYYFQFRTYLFLSHFKATFERLFDIIFKKKFETS